MIFLQVALKFSRPFWRTKVGEADFFGRISNTREARGMFGVFYDLSPKENKSQKTATSAPITLSDLCQMSSPLPPSSKGETTAATTTTHPTQTTSSTTSTTTSMTPTATPNQTSSPLLHSLSAKSAKLTGQDGKSAVYILVTTVSGEALNEYQKLSDVEIVSKCLACLRGMFPGEDVPAPSGHVVSRWGADPFAQMSYSYAAVGSTGEDYDHMAQDMAGMIFFAGEVPD